MLAVELRRARLAFVVVDPWEVRSTGTLVAPRSLVASLRRVVRREKPTVIVASSTVATVAMKGVAGSGIAVAPPPRRCIPRMVAAELYPELAWYAPTPELARVARMAITHILRSPKTYRRYVHRSHRPTLRAS